MILTESKFNKVYGHKNKLSFRICRHILPFVEFCAIFAFTFVNLRTIESELKAGFYASLIALLFVGLIHNLRKVQYRWWKRMEMLYCLFLVVAGGGFIWRVVAVRTGGDEGNLLQDPVFALSTMFLVLVGALYLDYYPGHPKWQHEFAHLESLKNKLKDKQAEKDRLDRALDRFSSEKETFLDVISQGAQSSISNLEDRENVEEYVQDLKKGVSVKTDDMHDSSRSPITTKKPQDNGVLEDKEHLD